MTAMRALVFSVIVVLLALVAGENNCKERCCMQHNNIERKKNNRQPIRRAIKQNLSNCIENCLESQGADFRNISKKCVDNNKGGVLFDRLPTGNNTKKIACNDLLKADYATNNFSASPGGIGTHFYRQSTGNQTYDYVNITWTPLNITDKSKIWNYYAVLFIIGEVQRSKKPPCHFALVPKDQTFLVINLSSNLYTYKYPRGIHFNVFTYPFKRNNTGALLSLYGYPGKPSIIIEATFAPRIEQEITSSLMAAIIVGTCAGIAFCIAVAVAWKLYGRLPPSFVPKRSISQIVEEESQVYLSYYNENDQFIEYIMSNVVKPLINMGYVVMMDKMYLNDQVDEGPARWAQTHIASSSKVIVVCSPRYVEICQRGQAAVRDNRSKTEESRVWFEIQIISNIYTKNKSASKIICLWMNNGRLPNGLPPWMGVTYTWPKDIDEIVKRLKRPNRKTFTLSSTTESNLTYSMDISDDDVFEGRSSHVTRSVT